MYIYIYSNIDRWTYIYKQTYTESYDLVTVTAISKAMKSYAEFEYDVVAIDMLSPSKIQCSTTRPSICRTATGGHYTFGRNQGCCSKTGEMRVLVTNDHTQYLAHGNEFVLGCPQSSEVNGIMLRRRNVEPKTIRFFIPQLPLAEPWPHGPILWVDFKCGLHRKRDFPRNRSPGGILNAVGGGVVWWMSSWEANEAYFPPMVV